MKKILGLLVFMSVIILGVVEAAAVNEFSDAENNSAVFVEENTWTEFDFDSDILLKINESEKNTISIFEVNTDDINRSLHYFVFSKSKRSIRTQDCVETVPSFIAVPHLDDVEAGYIKIDYDASENKWLRGNKIEIRLRTVSCDIDGWEDAVKIGLNEEHIIKFTSMSDKKWYKLVVPDEKFRYTYSIDDSNQGCFIGVIYTEDELMMGSGKASFCDCIEIKPSKITIDTRMGSGTYYIKLYPVPFYEDILNTKFLFATDNKDSGEIVQTSFGASVSTWAKDEVEKAYANGLIPKKMAKGDLTKKVTREEFAAIAVELYEELTSKSVGEATNCHFTDIGDSDYSHEIKKAYAIEAVEGISSTQYAPRDNITREQLATIMCRVLKRNMEEMGIPFQYVTDYQPFADDYDISDWAKPSVYFMASEGLVKGISDNLFAPKNVTEEQEAIGYASATKEQAIIIAQRIFSEN